MVGGRREHMGTSLIKKSPPPPQDHHRALGIVLLQGLGGKLFLMSETPLHREESEQVCILLHEKRRCRFLTSAHTRLL